MKQYDNMPQSSLRSLLQGCIKGSSASQARLYYLYADKMLQLCMQYAHNREEAEEALQDGFMRVFTYLHTFRIEEAFDGWIRKIMINATLLKHRNKTSVLNMITGYDPNIHDERIEPDFITKYDETELLRLVQQLPSSYRTVFHLHVLKGFSHGQIAEILNISKGTSKSNLADARRSLKAIFEKHHIGHC